MVHGSFQHENWDGGCSFRNTVTLHTAGASLAGLDVMQSTTSSHGTAGDLRLLLPEHHEEVYAACEVLRASVVTDDPLDVLARYRNLEHAVLEHMKAEEDFILPAYAKHARTDAAAIRATHDELRRKLHRLGVDTELRALWLEAIDRLVATLRAHAAHEDRGMYPWAQTVLAPATKREVFKRIAHSLSALEFFDTPPHS